MVGISVVGQLERQVKSVSNFENNSRNKNRPSILGHSFFCMPRTQNDAPQSQLSPGEVSRRSVQFGGVGALAKRRHAMLCKEGADFRTFSHWIPHFRNS